MGFHMETKRTLLQFCFEKLWMWKYFKDFQGIAVFDGLDDL